MKATKTIKRTWMALTALSYLLLILPVFGKWSDIPNYMTVTLILSVGVTLWIMAESVTRWRESRGRQFFPPKFCISMFLCANPLVLGIFFEVMSAFYPGPPF